MPLKRGVVKRDSGDYLVVDFTASDERRFDVFAARVARLIRGGRRRIILNFVHPMEFDPESLRILHRLLKMARFRFADIRVVVPSTKMRETFLLTRLDIFTRIYDSLEEAKKERGFIPFIKYGSVFAAGAFVPLYFHTLRWLVFSWGIDPYYSHGFLVAAASLFLLWRRRRGLRNPLSHFSLKSFSLIGLSALLYLVGCFRGANFLLGFSLVFFLLGVVLLLYGRNVYQQIFLPTALLFFTIPLPRLDEATSFLQHQTALWAAGITSKLGVAAYPVGVDVFFGELHIVIDAPCSGLRSLIALLFVGTLFVGLLRTSLPRKLLLLLSVIPIGILSNLLRVTVLILVANAYGLKAAMFYFHYLSGLLFFTVALAILFMEKGLLRCGLKAA